MKQGINHSRILSYFNVTNNSTVERIAALNTIRFIDSEGHIHSPGSIRDLAYVPVKLTKPTTFIKSKSIQLGQYSFPKHTMTLHKRQYYAITELDVTKVTRRFVYAKLSYFDNYATIKLPVAWFYSNILSYKTL